MKFLRNDEVCLVRDKPDVRAKEAHCRWKSRICANMALEKVMVKQPRRQRFDENLVIYPEEVQIGLFAHQDFPAKQLLAMERPGILQSPGKP